MTDITLSAHAAFLRRRRHAVLLAALMSLVVVGPLFGVDHHSETDLAILFSLVILGMTVSARRTAPALGLAVMWLALFWLRPLGDGPVGEIASGLVLLGICLVAAECALRRALGSGVVDAEELCAAMSAYVLLGVMWAAVYSVLHALDPGAFNLSPQDAEAPWNALLYFSFVTLTTLGYGDILPVSSLARAWAGVEAMTGTVYLAVLVAHLVGRFKSGAASHGGENIPLQ